VSEWSSPEANHSLTDFGELRRVVATLSGARLAPSEIVLNLQSPQCSGSSHDIVATRANDSVHSHGVGVECKRRVGCHEQAVGGVATRPISRAVFW